MSIVDSLTGLARAVKGYLLKNGEVPKTAEYTTMLPMIFGSSNWQQRPAFGLTTADLMCLDEQVWFATCVSLGPLMNGKVKATGESKEVNGFAQRVWDKLWQDHAQQFHRARLYGRLGGEVVYEQREGLIEVKEYLDRHPVDTYPLTKNGKVVGVAVQNVRDSQRGKVALLRGRGLWLVHDPLFNALWGQSMYRTAYGPWWEKACPGGALDLRRLRFVKDAWIGDIFRYPSNGQVTYSDGTTLHAREVVREAADNRASGGSICIPSDLWATGEKMYDYIPPQAMNGQTQIGEWVKDLDDGIFKGLLIPKEVVEAASTGSGFSGRSIPLVSFLAMHDLSFRSYVKQIKEQVIDLLVWLNFGLPAVKQYELEAVPLIETMGELMGPMGQPNTSASDGPAPPQPGQAPAAGGGAAPGPKLYTGSTQFSGAGEFKEEDHPRDEAGRFTSTIASAELHKRSGYEFGRLQQALGYKKPVMGEAGAERIRRSLSKLPGGRVIEALLAVDGSETRYDPNGYADRGQDAYFAAINGRFSRKELDAAAAWLHETYNNSHWDDGEGLAHVNQYRWLRGTVRAVKSREDVEQESEPEFSLRNDPPKPARSKFAPQERTAQRKLLDGMDALPGQLDLFSAAGRAPAPEGARWITIGGHEEGDKKHAGGFPVQISGDGTILRSGGPQGLVGKNVRKAYKHFQGLRAKKDAERAKAPPVDAPPAGETGKPQNEPAPVGAGENKGAAPVEGGAALLPQSDGSDPGHVWRVQPVGSKLHAKKSTDSNDEEINGVFVFDNLNELPAIDWLNEKNVELVKVKVGAGETFKTGDQEGVGLKKGKGKIVARQSFDDVRAVKKWALESQNNGWSAPPPPVEAGEAAEPDDGDTSFDFGGGPAEAAPVDPRAANPDMPKPAKKRMAPKDVIQFKKEGRENVAAAAREYGLDERELATVVHELWTEKRAALVEREKAKGEAKRALSVNSLGAKFNGTFNSKKAAAWEDAGHDYSEWPGIDETATLIANEYPELGLRTGPGVDTARQVWDLVKEPYQEIVDKSNKRLIDAAAEYLAFSKKNGDLDSMVVEGEDDGEPYQFSAAVDFARAGVAAEMRSRLGELLGDDVWQFAAYRPAPGQRGLFEESDHPRADDGKFAEKAGGGAGPKAAVEAKKPAKQILLNEKGEPWLDYDEKEVSVRHEDGEVAHHGGVGDPGRMSSDGYGENAVEWAKSWLWGRKGKGRDKFDVPTEKVIGSLSKYVPKEETIKLYRSHIVGAKHSDLESWVRDPEITFDMIGDEGRPRELISRDVPRSHILVDFGMMPKADQDEMEHSWGEVVVAHGDYLKHMQAVRRSKAPVEAKKPAAEKPKPAAVAPGGYSAKPKPAAEMHGKIPTHKDGRPAKVKAKVGYHVTTPEAAAAILKGGFDPAKFKAQWRNDHGVSLSMGGIKPAASYFMKNEKGATFDPSKKVVLKVEMSGRFGELEDVGASVENSRDAKDYSAKAVKAGWDGMDGGGVAYVYNTKSIGKITAVSAEELEAAGVPVKK